MDNMESLYKGFKYYFDYDREKINYFLEVLKTLKEDKWEYECNREKYNNIFVCTTKKISYDNIKIIYKDYKQEKKQHKFEYELKVKVDDVVIYKTDDNYNELFIETVEFINRVKKITNGKTGR